MCRGNFGESDNPFREWNNETPTVRHVVMRLGWMWGVVERAMLVRWEFPKSRAKDLNTVCKEWRLLTLCEIEKLQLESGAVLIVAESGRKYYMDMVGGMHPRCALASDRHELLGLRNDAQWEMDRDQAQYDRDDGYMWHS